MKTFVSNAVKASVVATLLSAPLSAKTNTAAYEDDSDFVAAPSAAGSVTDWSLNSKQTATATATATATTFEECADVSACRTFTVTGGNFTAVITNNVSGKTIQVPMGQAFQAPVTDAGIEYTITADVGQWGHFCYPQARTLTLTTADDGQSIAINIPCE